MSEAFTMTDEQKQLPETLTAAYGEKVYAQAVELSGLSLCLVSLGGDVLTVAERERMYRQASLHLAKLLATVMSSEHSAKVAECAKRIDGALDTWMVDEIEKREGFFEERGDHRRRAAQEAALVINSIKGSFAPVLGKRCSGLRWRRSRIVFFLRGSPGLSR